MEQRIDPNENSGDHAMSIAANASAFAQTATTYAAHRPRYPEALWDWVVAQCASKASAWDVGCGNGQASVALGDRFDHVLASDVSAEQIAAAQPHPNVTYQAVSAEDAQIAPASLDLVCAAQALHWFDLARFWPLVHRALKPDGLFVAVSYGLFEIDREIDSISAQCFHQVVSPYQSAANHSIGDAYKGVQFPFAMLNAPAFAIEIDWSLDQFLAYASTWSAVTRMRKEAGVDPMPSYRAALEPVWGSAPRRVRMPLVLKAGRVPG